MDVQQNSGRRPYRLGERARKQEATRRRITEAAVELHGAVGAARTTISAIAERAGVERLTVYRHFPDARSLFEACSAHWLERHPPPDPAPWTAIPDRDARVRTAVSELYAYYDGNEQMLANNLRDAVDVPLLAEVMQGLTDYLGAVAAILVGPGDRRGEGDARLLAAAGYVVDFETWRSLQRRRGLPRDDAVDLACLFVVAVAAGTEAGA